MCALQRGCEWKGKVNRIYNDTALYNARLFDRAYRILNDKVQAGGKTKNEFDMALVVPTAVNCAFSCELFLKAMLPNGTRGHKLFHELFKKLDLDIAGFVQDSVIHIMIHEGKANKFDLKYMSTFQACLKRLQS